VAQLLILTGPQGAGNHLFAKLFSAHPEVNGWTRLLDEYWIGHDQEPFSALWRDPTLVKDYPWHTAEYHVTSISCPYRDNGRDAWPDYRAFIAAVEAQNIVVKIAIIGRDQNILQFQETRLRGRVTYPDFLHQIYGLMPHDPVFVSQELLYLYREAYVHQLSRILDFPILFDASILEEDANAKYLSPVDSNWLDPLIHKASGSQKKQ